jgi:2-polyprenyl-3-methyl-5-hydroxy-6-metoxy-1,4-benzoquinol methylase
MDIETTNHQKFQTGNPIVRRLIGNFFGRVRASLAACEYASLLDAGCGEGHTLDTLADLLPERVAGFDINPDCVAFARQRLPQHIELQAASIYEIPYPDNHFDVVVCCEVLEHLDRPHEALAELKRVARQHLIISVPYEPWFQLGSLLRGKYLSTWGNHPEHVNHWNPRSLRRFLSEGGIEAEVQVAFPWLIAAAHV